MKVREVVVARTRTFLSRVVGNCRSATAQRCRHASGIQGLPALRLKAKTGEAPAVTRLQNRIRPAPSRRCETSMVMAGPRP